MIPHVLLVEDEDAIASLVETYLRAEGYRVTRVADGQSALDEIERGEHDLVLLDLMLPGVDGIEVSRRLREDSSLPVIMMTARDAGADRILGLESGADDYLTKPFNPRELMLRVAAVLRRSGKRGVKGANESRVIGSLTLDPPRRQTSVGGNAIELTAREFDLLERLTREPGVVLDRGTLLKEVWGYSQAIDTRTVDAHVKTLRRKLGEAGEMIATVRGVGYRVDDAR